MRFPDSFNFNKLKLAAPRPGFRAVWSMVPELLVLALEFYRAPLRFNHLIDPALPLPEAFDQWLTAASEALTAEKIRTTATALDTQPEILREAFLFFLRQTLLTPWADHYRILGLSRSGSEASIKRHYSLLVRLFHPDRRPGETAHNSLLTARINAAYRTLSDPQLRQRYDMQLPPLPYSSRTPDYGSKFFRPSGSNPKFGLFARRPLLLPKYLRWAIIWMFAVSVFILVVLSVLEDAGPVPALRINPELAAGR